MALFVVLGTPPTTPLEQSIQSAFSGDYKTLGTAQWLVSAAGLTTQEITEKLGAANGEKGEVFVASVQNVWGWHRAEVWEWIQARQAKVA